MKIQLASDLHLEYLQRNFPGERLIQPALGADMLVLAGDIANGTDAITLFKNWPVPVLYVAGNHEFYNQPFEQTRSNLQKAAEDTPIHFLDNDAVEFDGVRFLGSTLWTDYRLGNLQQEALMAQAERTIRDHHVIPTKDGLFTAAKALKEHEVARDWLQRELAKPYDGKTVVVTHHAPHPLSIHRRYADDPVNAAFASQLDDLLCLTDVWLHGHVHDSFDYITDGCHVVANPCGYVLHRMQVRTQVAKVSELRFENPAFERACVIDI